MKKIKNFVMFVSLGLKTTNISKKKLVAYKYFYLTCMRDKPQHTCRDSQRTKFSRTKLKEKQVIRLTKDKKVLKINS